MSKTAYNFTKEKLYNLHYNKNMPVTEIAKLYGCHRDTVRNAMYKFSIVPRGKIKISESTDLVTNIKRLYKQTHSVRIVERETGINRKILSEILKDNGVNVLNKEETAKYTWKNHKHPRLGMTGERCPVYGHKMSEEVRRKVIPLLKERAIKRRLGRKKQSGGYMLVYRPEHPYADKSGYVLEHRIVVEQVLGRVLLPDECVHHINENKTDNNIENLLVLTRSEHAKLHNELRKRNVK